MAIVLAVVFALTDPQLLVVPLGILIFLVAGTIRKTLAKFPLVVAYIFTGTLFGVIVEICAMLNYANNASNNHLVSLDPATNLIITTFFYFLATIGVYIIVKKYSIQVAGLFGCAAFFSIMLEQQGQVFLAGIANPLFAPLYWGYVAAVYSFFVVVPYWLLKDRFEQRQRPHWWTYPLLVIVMLVCSLLGFVIGEMVKRMVLG